MGKCQLCETFPVKSAGDSNVYLVGWRGIENHKQDNSAERCINGYWDNNAPLHSCDLCICRCSTDMDELD
jgi:hypothetical protein